MFDPLFLLSEQKVGSGSFGLLGNEFLWLGGLLASAHILLGAECFFAGWEPPEVSGLPWPVSNTFFILSTWGTEGSFSGFEPSEVGDVTASNKLFLFSKLWEVGLVGLAKGWKSGAVDLSVSNSFFLLSKLNLGPTGGFVVKMLSVTVFFSGSITVGREAVATLLLIVFFTPDLTGTGFILLIIGGFFHTLSWLLCASSLSVLVLLLTLQGSPRYEVSFNFVSDLLLFILVRVLFNSTNRLESLLLPSVLQAISSLFESVDATRVLSTLHCTARMLYMPTAMSMCRDVRRYVRSRATLM